MKAIKLGQAKKSKYSHLVALVDDEDFERLNKFRWAAQKSKKSTTYYVGRRIEEAGKSINYMMHWAVIGKPENEMVIDHIDGNGLNNQKSNLRKCTQRQNLMNRPGDADSTSKYKGVDYKPSSKKWRVQITENRKKKHIGCFNTEYEAALAYNEAAKRCYGEFARLNII